MLAVGLVVVLVLIVPTGRSHRRRSAATVDASDVRVAA
jgi:hypothetical protein